MSTVVPLFAIPGGPELLIILAIFVLLFGANKLPGLARSSGEALGEFKKGRQQIENELAEEMEAIEEPTTERPRTERAD